MVWSAARLVAARALSEGVFDMKHHIAILALAGAAGLLAGSAAHADEMRYHLADTLTGSMLPQEIMRSALPFDSRYEELTPADKATLARDYESLPPGDEPPYPLYGLRHMVKPLVRFADTYSPVGPLVASVMVDSQGHAGEVTVYKSPDPQLTRVVVAALALESYKPALCHGQPCKMAYVLRLDFPRRGTQPVRTTGFTNSEQDKDTLMHH